MSQTYANAVLTNAITTQPTGPAEAQHLVWSAVL
jgi:hypothetical protein